MISKFTILACANYATEAQKILDDLGIPALRLVVMPTNCTKCLRYHEEAMKDFLTAQGLKEGDYWLLGDVESTSTLKPRYSLCHTALTNESLINYWQKNGFYLVTPGWLNRWERLIYDEWGFDQVTAPVFLRESIRKIMFLDSGVYENIEVHLKSFSDLCQASYETMPVGLSYLMHDITRVYYAWIKSNVEKNIKAERQKSAEYSIAFELIMEHTGVQDTIGVIERIENVGYLLTAARKVHYIKYEAFEMNDWNHFFDQKALELAIMDTNKAFQEGVFSADGKHLMIGLKFGDIKLGYLVLENILFPDRIRNYQQLFLNLAPVFAVNLMNAAHFEALEDEKQIVIKANKAKDAFLSVMSHEVRGPLNGVSGALQLIRRGGIKEDQNELLEIAENALDSLLSSINTILDYTKVKSGSKELELASFTIHMLITDVFNAFKGLSQLKNIELVETIHENAKGTFVGDYGKLKQILLNILGNALKFTERGSVEAIVRRIGYDTTNGILLEFVLLDTGTGIPQDKLDAIFDAFVQGDEYTASRYGGTGLGLAIAKELVEILGGSIKAENRAMNGSALTFTCYVQDAKVQQESELKRGNQWS